MKTTTLAALTLLTLAIAACDTITTNKDGTTTTTKPDQAALDSTLNALGPIAQIALNVAAVKLGVPATSPAAMKTAAADLSGIAAQSQANVGQTPVVANVAQGAANPAIGKAVQAALPSEPISQGTVQQIFDAATAVNKAAHSTSSGSATH